MERHIRLEGCLNFRDLGGYGTRDGRRLRWRRLFRSDALGSLSASDVGHLRDSLGLAAVVDLRSGGELERIGRGRLAGEPMAFHHRPLFEDGSDPISEPRADRELGYRYFLLAEQARERIGGVISLLAAGGRPAVVHCAAGKDRTGIVSALVLALVGVDDDRIAEDYALTREKMAAILGRLRESESYRELLEEVPPHALEVEPETIHALLGHLREAHGDLRGYARAAGVSEASLARLVDTLVE